MRCAVSRFAFKKSKFCDVMLLQLARNGSAVKLSVFFQFQKCNV
jgi:hypothetical protein